MKINLDCYPCITRHVLDVSRLITGDKELQLKIMKSSLQILQELPAHLSPPEIACRIHREIRKMTGNRDPYKEVKKKYNNLALSMYDNLKNILKNSNDTLETALKLSCAGNIIDFGAFNGVFDLNRIVENAILAELKTKNYAEFQKEVSRASTIAYLGDNTGEIVFDKLLIGELLKISAAKIYFIVRGRPVLNDATAEDAEYVGINRIADVISDENDCPAFITAECSKKALDVFNNADVIISKGQGNYEALSESPKNIYFLLHVKCFLVAKNIQGELGDNILKKSYP